MKYIELVKGLFTADHEARAKQLDPYVAYSKEADRLMFSIVPEENQSGYQMIDLGLSVKWADRNVGAETPQDAGLYFDWGNIDGHAVDEEGNVADGYSFDSTTYSTTLGGQYTGSILDAEHDAATANMGGDWRMPTSTETSELVQNTDHYYIDEDGSVVAESELSDSKKLRSICFVKKGEEFNYNVRSNFIEFPFAGGCRNTWLTREGFSCCVWSSYRAYSEESKYMTFSSDGYIYGDITTYKYSGYSVRGVHA